MSRARFAWLWLIPFLLISFWLGSRNLNADPVWMDEYASVLDALGFDDAPRPTLDVWQGVGTRNPWHAPGFFMTLNVWGRLVGREPPVLRVLALLVGMLAVAWTYRLGRAMVSPRVGVYAAAILGSSAFFVYYLHELRMYTLFAMLTAFTLWAYLRVVHRRREPTRWHWLGLLVGAIGLLYTHYFASLPLAVIGLYHLWLGWKAWRGQAISPRRWWTVVGVLALAGLTFLPWLGFLAAGLGRAAEADELRARALTPLEATERLAYLFSNGAVLLLGALLVLAAIYVVRRRGRGWQAWYFTGSLLVVLLTANAILQLMHGGRIRYMMGLFPLLSVLVGVGLAWLPRRIAAVILLAWVSLGVWNSSNAEFGDVDGTLPQYPTHRVVQSLRGDALPSDVVVNFEADLANRHFSNMGRLYFETIPVGYMVVTGLGEEVGVQRAVLDGQEVVAPPLDVALNYERLWLSVMPGREPEAYDTFVSRLTRDYTLCAVPADEPDMFMTLWARAEACCFTGDSFQPRFRFGDGITLGDAPAFPDQADDTLMVGLLWQITGDVPPHLYSVGVQVFDAAGEKVLQSDYGLEAQAYTCGATPLDVSNLPPGDYEVRVTVYNWQTGERLPGTVLASGEGGELLTVGRFEKTAAPRNP